MTAVWVGKERKASQYILGIPDPTDWHHFPRFFRWSSSWREQSVDVKARPLQSLYHRIRQMQNMQDDSSSGSCPLWRFHTFFTSAGLREALFLQPCPLSSVQVGSHYCQGCAYKKGICAMCGKKVLETKNYRQTSTWYLPVFWLILYRLLYLLCFSSYNVYAQYLCTLPGCSLWL